MKPGDILGFSGRAWQSQLICLATWGLPLYSLSHVGIIAEHKNELVLFESTTLDNEPCLLQGTPFKGSQAHRLESRIANYPGRVYHYPLYRRLYDFERRRLSAFLHGSVGVPYDEIGAFRSGGIGWSWLESHLHESNLSSLFCSEWCAAAHADIGIFVTDNVSRWSPNKLVRAERRRELLHKPVRLK